MEFDDKSRPQQLDAMVATIRNIQRLKDGDRKRGLIEAAHETLIASEARGEITTEAREFMERLLRQGDDFTR